MKFRQPWEGELCMHCAHSPAEHGAGGKCPTCLIDKTYERWTKESWDAAVAKSLQLKAERRRRRKVERRKPTAG